MAEGRKHCVFAQETLAEPFAALAPPAIHPARAAQAPALAAEGRKTEKSDRKKKYLAKKNKKHRKLAAARKAAAPKNKEFNLEDNDEDEGMSVVTVSTAAVPASTQANGHDSHAGPSRQPVNVSSGHLDTVNGTQKSDDPDEEERARRKAEKRAKREARQANPERAEKKAKKRKRHDGDDGATAVSASITQSSAGEERSTPSAQEEQDDPMEVEDAPDPVNTETAAADREPSPPPLQPFPLPTAAAAPSPSLLSRQGLPANLSSATLIPQSLRTPVSNLSSLSEHMSARLSALGITELFAVQAALLPVLLGMRLVPYPAEKLPDYLISAPTGSGKTLAYAVPIVEMLSTRFITRLRALVVLPTRELVEQVKEVMESLVEGTDLKVGSISGKQSFAKEQDALIADRSNRLLGGSSKYDILIATPGRLIDHLQSTQNFSLQHLRFLVIDEADRLLSQSFQNWLAQVLEHVVPPVTPNPPSSDFQMQPHDQVDPAWLDHFGLIDRSWEGCPPSRHTCQKLLFSATLTRDPASIAALQLRDPQYYIVRTSDESGTSLAEKDNFAVDFGESFALPSSLIERSLILPPALKPLNLIHLIHSPEWKVRRGLVFTKSVESADRLVNLLQAFEEEYSKKAKHRMVIAKYAGDLAPAKRKALLESFENDQTHILVCSDLVSRGLDLPTVSHVVSYDVPLDMRKYVHRVGRTARAGREGVAWTIVEKQEALHWKAMLKQASHEKKVKKVKIKEDELESYKPAYERAMTRLRALYAHD